MIKIWNAATGAEVCEEREGRVRGDRARQEVMKPSPYTPPYTGPCSGYVSKIWNAATGAEVCEDREREAREGRERERESEARERRERE